MRGGGGLCAEYNGSKQPSKCLCFVNCYRSDACLAVWWGVVSNEFGQCLDGLLQFHRGGGDMDKNAVCFFFPLQKFLLCASWPTPPAETEERTSALNVYLPPGYRRLLGQGNGWRAAGEGLVQWGGDDQKAHSRLTKAAPYHRTPL